MKFFNKLSTRLAIRVAVILIIIITASYYYLVKQETKRIEDQLLARAKMASMIGAKAVGKILDEAIDNGVLTVKDVFDTNYQKFGNFDPPKYHTKYDFYLDKAILSLEDEFLKDELKDDLSETFRALKENLSAGKLNATQDDIDVFNQLIDIELDDIPVWHSKNIGEWQIVCNAMRRLRPARSSSQVLHSIKQPYDESRFHFNKPFLKLEILWEGDYNGLNSRVLFNKFPFSDYHLLIVVSPESNNSQLLTQGMHRYAFSLVQDMATVLPGFGVGFNSLAAGASVNHFHFQGFIREQAFAIEKDCWSFNAGTVDYSLEVKRFSDAEISWRYIEELIEQDVAFNCLYRNDSCYVVPRKYQGTVTLPDWLSGAGWLDMAGSITVSDEETFNVIDASSVSQALALLKK
jgi:diadenosine tetraphosphate (Ap4A) HIT family hydrolase